MKYDALHSFFKPLASSAKAKPSVKSVKEEL